MVLACVLVFLLRLIVEILDLGQSSPLMGLRRRWPQEALGLPWFQHGMAMRFLDLAPLSSLPRWKRHSDHGPVSWVVVGRPSCEETCAEVWLSSSLMGGGRVVVDVCSVYRDLVLCSCKPSLVWGCYPEPACT